MSKFKNLHSLPVPTSTDVFYVLADGTEGSYRAPTRDLADAIMKTELQLMENAVAEGEFKEFTIVKAELVLA